MPVIVTVLEKDDLAASIPAHRRQHSKDLVEQQATLA